MYAGEGVPKNNLMGFDTYSWADILQNMQILGSLMDLTDTWTHYTLFER